MSNTTHQNANANVIFEGQPTCCGGFADWCKKTSWLITDQYIQRERGMCCASIDNLQLIRVKDIGFSTNCCCACCGVVTVYSTDETTPILKIQGIMNAREVYEKLRNAISKAQSNAQTQIEIK